MKYIELNDLQIDEETIVVSNGKEYLLIPKDAIDEKAFNGQVIIKGAEDLELNSEEYENLKKQILDSFDRIFKPKVDKMN